jgi:uracil-DNA glycosylase family 4
MNPSRKLKILEKRIVACQRCPRLIRHCRKLARQKRRAFREWTYWGKPVPGFGDPQARLLILGLAPAAHGANRTGRVFTGDRSGDFLYALLHRAGFASQPTSTQRDDGLKLLGAYISATVRCAPPANKPLPQEVLNCKPFLHAELEILQPKAILALGKIAWDGYLRLMQDHGQIARASAYHFTHGAEVRFPAGLPRLFASYHPSQQNTQTGRLTPAMFMKVLRRIRGFLDTH